MVKDRGRAYSPIKTTRLATCIRILVALGLMFRNLWPSAAMTAPKKGRFRLVSDYHAFNNQIEKVLGIMPNQEAEMANLRGVTCFGNFDMLRRYWQMPLAAEAQEICPPSPPPKVCLPPRVCPKAFPMRRPTSKV